MTAHMSFRKRIFLTLCLVTLISVAPFLALIVISLRHDAVHRIRQYQDDSITLRKQQLQSIIDATVGMAEEDIARTHAGVRSELEARRRFLEKVAAMRYDNGAGYIWIHEFKSATSGDTPRMILNPALPSSVGRPIDRAYEGFDITSVSLGPDTLSVRDPRLSRLGIPTSPMLMEMNQVCARQGEGFLQYFWVRPGAETPVSTVGFRKLSFVKLIPEWNWIVGTGVYLDDLDREVARRQESMRRQTRLVTAWAGLFALVIVLVNFGIAWLLARRLTRPLDTISRYAHSITQGDMPNTLVLQENGEFRRVSVALDTMARAVTERERELKARAAELDLLNRNLFELNNTKSVLLSKVSHELRTPLASILGHIELIETGMFGPVSEEQRAHIATCRRNVSTLNRLIEDMLCLAKSGNYPRHTPEIADLREIVRQAVETMRPQAGGRRQKLVEFHPETPQRVLVEPLRLERVFLNLLDNALKFSDPDQTVTVTVAPAAGGRHVTVTVADQGVGIPVEKQERIFEEFYQAEESLVRRFGGMGLGLSVVRLIVQESGGTVALQSEPGKGSTFTVTLPLTV